MATVVTSKGRDIISNRMKAGGTEPLNVGWGTGVFTAAVSDVGPFIEASEARVAGTSSQATTTTANDTYQVVATITAAGSKTITEVLLSDSASKPFSTTVAAGGVVGSAVSTTLNTAASYTPANGTSVQIRTEVMTVTAGTGTTALTVTRGANGSSAISSITAGDTVTAGNAPGASAVTNGSLFLHGDFTGLALNTNDSIAFTCKTQFS